MHAATDLNGVVQSTAAPVSRCMPMLLDVTVWFIEHCRRGQHEQN